MSSPLTVIFSGPSLPDRDIARQHLAGDYRPPAAQGDVVRAALQQPPAIVLIDGYFERQPAVYHKEILWALDRGISVYGAASMGALRAAELQSFGMIGVGEIFEAYASDVLIHDDEVALVHAPAEANYQLLSDPLVNIRWTLELAVKQGVIERELGQRLIAYAQAVFYPYRNFAAMLEEFATGQSAGAIKQLAEWLPAGRLDQKQIDALACLDRVASDLADGVKISIGGFTFNHTDAFESLLAEVSNDPAGGMDRINFVDEARQILRALAPEKLVALETEAVIEALALRLDRYLSEPISKEALAREVVAFRNENAVADSEELSRWMAERELNIETLSKELEVRAKIVRARAIVEAEIDAQIAKKLMPYQLRIPVRISRSSTDKAREEN